MKIPFEEGAWYKVKRTGEYVKYEFTAVDSGYVHHWFRSFNLHLDDSGNPRPDVPVSWTFDYEPDEVVREDAPDDYIKPAFEEPECPTCGCKCGKLRLRV